MRSEITGFSQQSKSRLQKQLMVIDWEKVAANKKKAAWGRAFFITLTYPGKYPAEGDEVKANFRAWIERMVRALGKVGIFWKLELQERGAPHFHVVVFAQEKMAWREVKKAAWSWKEIVPGSKSVGVETVYVKDGNTFALMFYLLKYLGKKWQSEKSWGRVWGFRYKDLVPMVPVDELTVKRADFVRLVEDLKDLRPRSGFIQSQEGEHGFDVFGPPEEFRSMLSKYQE